MSLPRYFLLLTYTLLCSSLLRAQDKIYLQNSIIQGKITEISATEIKYLPLEKAGTTLILPLSKALILINGKGMVLIPSRQESDNPPMTGLIAGFLSPDTNRIQKDQLFLLPGKKTEGTITKEDKNFISLSDGTLVEKKNLVAIIYRNGQSMIYGPTEQAAALFNTFQQEALFKKQDPLAAITAATAAPLPPPVPSAASPSMKAPVDTAILPHPPAGADDSAQSATFAALAPDVPKKEFEEKAARKTTQFTEYLKILCDKTAGYEDINKAISQAVTLFVNDGAMIETSSNNSNNISRLKIRDYLNKVKRIQYDRIEIEWTHVQYVSDLKPGPDGNFYGVVSFEQVFRGYRDGKLVYSDITRKNATVVLKTYQKNVEGTTKSIWDVLLSDIGVISTKSL